MKSYHWLTILKDGCDVTPHCLECPLPHCRFDDLDGYRDWQRRQRLAAVSPGSTISEAAAQLGITTRQVFRWRAKGIDTRSFSDRS